jgi:2-amino-4-hydroxy-6-hydroxymethyldihydropteridine diphosphokinase
VARLAVGFGSNLGDRAARILGGVAGCAAHGFKLLTFSRLYETDPEGGPAGQDPYLNAAAAFESGLDAMVVLRILQSIEAAEGRVRGERNAPRTLDIDLLLYGNEVRSEADLTLPHPRLLERLFVLVPLAEVLHEAPIPGTGLTVAGALRGLAARTPDADRRVRLYKPT